MSDKLAFKEKGKQLWLFFAGSPPSNKATFILLVLLAGFLLFQSLAMPPLMKLKALGRQFRAQKKLADYYESLLKDASLIKEGLEEKQRDFSILAHKFIEEKDLPEYSEKFRKTVADYGLTIISLDFKPQEELKASGERPFKFYQELPFEVIMKGNPFKVMRLLQKIIEGNPFSAISSLKVKQAAGGSCEVVAEIKATVFIIKKINN